MENYILIIDDHFTARSVTSILLETELNRASVFEVHNFREAIIACRTIIFDLVILDINLPFGRKCKIIDLLRNLQKEVKIMMLSGYHEDVYALRYIRAGANAYLSKQSNAMSKVVEIVLKSEQNISIDKLIAFPQNGEKIVNPLENLTQREFEIAVLLVRGLKKPEIAKELGIKEATIRTRKFNILKKLKIANITKLSELFEPLSKSSLEFVNN